ncbi:sensor histidine kinase [Roseicyclus sp. F158]|uniref:histidine kinase n=1 Tax=Tropicimonas omnivorans TaxID=3075590 RepID=A0ABU3DKA7_9RHOB|nr:sensor histidine kinase [Roseicyclus sp. F158]MDT0684155.1 sensor histidine kinase [Roseicyclus sp. F158]
MKRSNTGTVDRSSDISAWSRRMSLVVAAVSAAVLVLGWGAGIDFLRRIRPDFAAMVPSTTICFMLLSAGVFMQTRMDGRLVQTICAILAGAIAAVDLVVRVASNRGGIDDFFVSSLPSGDGMAFATAACVILASYSLGALAWSNSSNPRAFQWPATLGLLAAMVALVGYAFDTRALYGVFVFTAMALHTALLFLLLFIGLLLVAPRQTWIGILIGSEPGSLGARRLFPLVALAPVALCFVALQLTDAGIFNANFRLSVLAIAMTALASGAVLRNGYLENRADRSRARLMRDLESTSAERALLLKELYHRVKNNLQQINAMLRIEARKVDDPHLSTAFQSISDRIAALGVVHQLLISAPTPSEVEVEAFLTDLCRGLAASHGLERRDIALEIEADPGRAHIEVAISMGLLVNELVTNSIKHAFGDGPGTIVVRYEERPDCLALSVSDDGAGGAWTIDSGGTGSLIIRSMVSQLKADLQTWDRDGMYVEVTMPRDINQLDRYE